MKRNFYISQIILFVLVLSVNAQNNFKYGIKIGMSSSQLKLTDVKKGVLLIPPDFYDDTSNNPMIGAFVSKDIFENIVLEAELSIIQKGSRKTQEMEYTTIEKPDGTGQKSDVTYGVNARYLEFGINLKPSMNFGNVDVYLIAGPTVNYLLLLEYLIYDLAKDFSFGYKLGVGIDFKKLSDIPFFFEVKYNGEFTEFYSTYYAKLWNRAVVFNAGLYLN